MAPGGSSEKNKKTKTKGVTNKSAFYLEVMALQWLNLHGTCPVGLLSHLQVEVTPVSRLSDGIFPFGLSVFMSVDGLSLATVWTCWHCVRNRQKGPTERVSLLGGFAGITGAVRGQVTGVCSSAVRGTRRLIGAFSSFTVHYDVDGIEKALRV